MKNIVRIVAIIAFMMIGLTSVTKAQNINFWVNLTDSCSGTWSGDYCIEVSILLGSTHYCYHTQCGLSTTSSNHIYYPVCPQLPQITDPGYYICYKVCRDSNPPTCCTSGMDPTGYTMLQLKSGTIQEYITLH
jgi:hypothetical protein